MKSPNYYTPLPHESFRVVVQTPPAVEQNEVSHSKSKAGASPVA